MCVFICLGYEGKHCQVDINECEQHPCENGGECFQLSNILNYGMLPELTKSNFSFGNAAGFICHCLPGFTGKLQGKPISFFGIYSLPHHETTSTKIYESHFCACRRQLHSQRG